MKITKISAAVKTAGRYNIFVDDEYSFSLDENQLLELKLATGAEIDDDDLVKFKKESNFGKNYIRAVDLISRRFRSEKEIRDYAFKKQWTLENRDRVIKRLYDRGYLNDEKFAKSFVRSRAIMKNFSKRKMEMELFKKGIDKKIIDQVMMESEDFDEQKSLKIIVEKKRSRYPDEQKFIRYLMGQGFHYDDIKNVLN